MLHIIEIERSGGRVMRMEYEKPFVVVERYALSQSISACATKICLLDSACVFRDPDSPKEMRSLAVSNWFTAGNCSRIVTGGQSKDGICYHTNANAAFQS